MAASNIHTYTMKAARGVAPLLLILCMRWVVVYKTGNKKRDEKEILDDVVKPVFLMHSVMYNNIQLGHFFKLKTHKMSLR